MQCIDVIIILAFLLTVAFVTLSASFQKKKKKLQEENDNLREKLSYERKLREKAELWEATFFDYLGKSVLKDRLYVGYRIGKTRDNKLTIAHGLVEADSKDDAKSEFYKLFLASFNEEMVSEPSITKAYPNRQTSSLSGDSLKTPDNADAVPGKV